MRVGAPRRQGAAAGGEIPTAANTGERKTEMKVQDVDDACGVVNGAAAGTEISPDTDQFLATHADAIRRLGKNIINDGIEIGRRLTEVSDRIGHGKWGPWIKAEFDWSETTARRFMNLYEFAQTNSAHLADLNMPVSALYLLAAPSISDELRNKVIERAKVEKVKHADVVEAIKKDTPIDWKGDAKRFPQFHRDKRYSSRPVASSKPEPEPAASGAKVVALQPQVEAEAAHFSGWCDARRKRQSDVVQALAALARFIARHGDEISTFLTEFVGADEFKRLRSAATVALRDGEAIGFLDEETAP